MAPPANLQTLIESLAYPGQSLPEGEVIRDWLRADGALYDQIDFNVHVGEGATMPEGLDPAIANFGKMKTQKKIDVLAWRGGLVTVVEAKLKLSLGVLGQLLGYGQLWVAEHPESMVAEFVAIARRADPDVVRVLTANGVRVELFEDLPSSATPAPFVEGAP